MRHPTATRRTRPQCTGGVHCACWGSQRGGFAVGGWLKMDANSMIEADRLPRLRGDAVFLEDMRHIVVAYSEYNQAYAYHKPKTEYTGRSRGRESSKARRPKCRLMMTSTMARLLSLSPCKSKQTSFKCSLALMFRRHVMKDFCR